MTLDVSKLSGWLKATAPCRVERRAYDAGRERRGPGGGVRALGANSISVIVVKRGATTGMNEWLPIAYRAHWALVWSAGSDPVPAP
eukprot:scaffold74437_cov60-Phaeocystis_antarctica.AAC.5